MKTVEDYIRSIPDFPEPGIIFRDITTVIQDPDGLQLAINEMQKKLDGVRVRQSRWNMRSSTALQRWKCIKIPFVPVRRLLLWMI